MQTQTWIYLAFIFIGAWARILAPFIRKTIFQGEPLKYDHLYTALFLVSFIMAVFASFSIYMVNPLDATGDPIILIGKGLLNGFSSQAIIDELAKYFFPKDWWKREEE